MDAVLRLSPRTDWKKGNPVDSLWEGSLAFQYAVSGDIRMRDKVLVVFLLAIGQVLNVGLLGAHHSESINDQDHLVTITGAVTKFVFTSPHVQIYLDAKDDEGKEDVAQWIATGGGPSSMRRTGWNSKVLKPGDRITITGFPYKDGRKIVFWLRILGPNGEEMPTADGIQGRLDRFLATHPDQKLDPPGKRP